MDDSNDDHDDARFLSDKWTENIRLQVGAIIMTPDGDRRRGITSFFGVLKTAQKLHYIEDAAGVITSTKYASILLFCKALELLLAEQDYDEPTLMRILYGLFEFSWSDEQIKGIGEEVARLGSDARDSKRGPDSIDYFRDYERLSLQEAAMRIAPILMSVRKHTLVRLLLSYAYKAYQEILKDLLAGSYDLTGWIDKMEMLIAYVLIRSCVPLYQEIPVRSPAIYISSDGQGGAFDSGNQLEVHKMFDELFDDAEIREFKGEEKRCAELFAHAHTALVHYNADQR